MTTLPRWASSSLLLQGSAYANCGNPPILNNLQSYTLEAWVNLATLTGAQAVVGKRNINVDAAYQLYIQNGFVFSYYPTAPNIIQSPTPLTVGEWNHLATTYDSTTGTLTLYINGIEVAEGVFAYGPYTSSAPVLIGATLMNGGYTWFLRGMVGEVMIWNVCRTPEQVFNDSVQISYQGDTAVPSLLMDLDFSYLPAADWAGNNIKFSLQPSAQYSMSVPGLRLQGQAYANCGTDPDLSMDGTKPYTIEGWFYYTNIGGTLVSKVDQGNAGEYLVTVDTKKIKSLRSGLNFSLSSIPQVVPYTYYHFATTYDHLTKLLSLYINGNLQASQYAPDMSSAPSVPFLIGATLSNTTLAGGPTNFFEGYIQNIRLWDTSLEQDQIQQWMYNQPILEPNLVAGFDFTVAGGIDTTGKHAIQLLNGAVVDELIIPIDPTSAEAYFGFIQSTNAAYMSEHEVPPDPPPTISPRVATAGAYAPFSPEFKNALWVELEQRALGDADEQTSQKMRDRFEQTYAQASAMVDENPNLLKPFTVLKENGLVKMIHHGIKGDALIFEAPAAEVDDCTLWWIGFTYQLTVGLFMAVGLLPSFGEIASRIWNLLRRNPTVIAVLSQAIGRAITIDIAFGILVVIIQQGYLWPILKLCFTALGWWALGWILGQVTLLVTGLVAPELFINLVLWVGALSAHSLNYKDACDKTSIEASNPLPSPAAA